MKRLLPILSAAALICAACTQTSPTTGQAVLMDHEDEIDRIIAQLTLEEKVEMLHSKTIMSSEVLPRLGLQEIRYADGPFAVREEVGDRFRPLGWKTDSATYFPTGSALAATWSEEMAHKYGNALGTEARRRGKDIILGPAINIQRLPVGGRSYEYLSEDPFLSARLTVGYTLGVQETGTGVCLKHYAVNNQELNRSRVNAIVDERTLREIYLKPFQAGVVEGGAVAVMTAYNKVNGVYCSENAHLNNEILRGEWGFKGMTISDWGGTHSTMGAALGGLDVQMTGDNYLGPALIDSVRAGKVSEAVVDDKVREILRVRLAIRQIPPEQANIEKTSQPEQQRVAYEVATKSIVLLKNDGLLPIDLAKTRKVAVVGPRINTKTANGGGGAGAKSPYEITALKGLQDRIGNRAEIVWSERDMSVARDADVVIFVGGTTRQQESEGRDRRDIFLPEGQDSLLVALQAVNPNIVTVIQSGGPCDLNVAQRISPALVQGWWNGLEGGHALADVLLGAIAPSGKLPFTFPKDLEDSPAFALNVYPQGSEGADLFMTRYRRDRADGPMVAVQPGEVVGPTAEYDEEMLVGYRWYDTNKVPVLYPFGYGLSYVTFAYSKLRTDWLSYGPDDVIKVSFTLKNEGDMAAEEVAQLYVRRIGADTYWPDKELKAFRRVALKAEESSKVTLEVPVSELRHWDKYKENWQLEPGRIEFLLGSSAADIRLRTECDIDPE